MNNTSSSEAKSKNILAQKTGKLGEYIATQYFQKKGFKVVARNYHIFGGEIDLIVKKNAILIFVEVKTRTNLNFGFPEEAFTPLKKQKILRAIHHFFAKKASQHQYATWRLDLISIMIKRGQTNATLQHFHNILSLDL